MSILKRHRPRYSLARTLAALTGMGVAGTLIACANPVPRDPDAQPAPRDQAIVPGEAQAQNRVIPAPSPEPASPATPEEVGTWSVAGASAMPEPASVADATPVRPEVAQDAGRQAFECNPGNGITVMRRSGEWTLHRLVDGMRLCMRSHGNVEMTSDGTAIQDMDDDSWLVLESQAARLHRLVITPVPGGLEYDWSIDGRPEAFDDEAEAWRDLMVTVMDGYMDVQEIRGEEASLRGQIAAHRGHVATLRGMISTHRGHVSTLRGQIATHRGHVAALRGEAAAHRGHVAGLRGQMHAPSAQAARVMSRLSAQIELIANAAAADDWTTLADDLQQLDRDLATRRAELEREAAALEREGIRKIEEEIGEYDLDGKIREIEAQIEELDTDRRADEIERSIQDEIAALRSLIG